MNFKEKMAEQTKQIKEFWAKHTEFTIDEAAAIWIIENAETFSKENA